MPSRRACTKSTPRPSTATKRQKRAPNHRQEQAFIREFTGIDPGLNLFARPNRAELRIAEIRVGEAERSHRLVPAGNGVIVRIPVRRDILDAQGVAAENPHDDPRVAAEDRLRATLVVGARAADIIFARRQVEHGPLAEDEAKGHQLLQICAVMVVPFPFEWIGAGSNPFKGERDYHYGADLQELVALRLIFGQRAMFDLTAREYYISGTGSDDKRGTETIFRGNAGIIVRIFGRNALGIQYVASHRDAHYRSEE